jgi:chromosome segregation ATPase
MKPSVSILVPLCRRRTAEIVCLEDNISSMTSMIDTLTNERNSLRAIQATMESRLTTTTAEFESFKLDHETTVQKLQHQIQNGNYLSEQLALKDAQLDTSINDQKKSQSILDDKNARLSELQNYSSELEDLIRQQRDLLGAQESALERKATHCLELENINKKLEAELSEAVEKSRSDRHGDLESIHKLQIRIAEASASAREHEFFEFRQAPTTVCSTRYDTR